MATVVSFTQKNGQPGKATFPSLALAQAYARTVKGATLSESSAVVANVVVKACPVATADLQKAASSAYYQGLKSDTSERLTSEQAYERASEHFAEARFSGQCMADAQSDFDYVNSR